MLVERAKGIAEESEGFSMVTRQYSVTDPALVFDILCNKMYSNPFNTMIQEYLANGRDAHREVGKRLTPLQVTLPTSLDSHLYIRDFGPGLTEQRIDDVFIKLGASTKNQDAEMTGGFGLGAKIGWAYGDSFTIISYVDGTKSTYLAFMNEDGIGTMNTLCVEPTFEPNGVTVKLYIKPSDVRSVVEVISKVTYFWEVAPVCETQVFRHHDERQLSTILYAAVPFSTSYNNSVYAIVDGIPYLVTQSSVPVLNKLALTGDKTLCMFFDASEVEVAINREGLKYSTKTIDMITHTIQSVMDSNIEGVRYALDTPIFEEKYKALCACYTRLGAPGEAWSEINPYLHMLFSYRVHKGALYISTGNAFGTRTSLYSVSRKYNVRDIISHRVHTSTDNIHKKSWIPEVTLVTRESLRRTSQLSITFFKPDDKWSRYILLTSDDTSQAAEKAKNRFRTIFEACNCTELTDVIVTQNKVLYDFFVNVLGYTSVNYIKETYAVRKASNAGSKACGFEDDDVKNILNRNITKKISALDPALDMWCTTKEREDATNTIRRCFQYLPGAFSGIQCFYITGPQAVYMQSSNIMHYKEACKKHLSKIPADVFNTIENAIAMHTTVKEVCDCVLRKNAFDSNTMLYALVQHNPELFGEEHVFTRLCKVAVLDYLFDSGIISNNLALLEKYENARNTRPVYVRRLSNRMSRYYTKIHQGIQTEKISLFIELYKQYPLLQFVHLSSYSISKNRNNEEEAFAQIVKYINNECIK